MTWLARVCGSWWLLGETRGNSETSRGLGSRGRSDGGGVISWPSWEAGAGPEPGPVTINTRETGIRTQPGRGRGVTRLGLGKQLGPSGAGDSVTAVKNIIRGQG